MTLPLLAAAVAGILIIGYRLYGGWVASQFNLDDARRTPAHEKNDGEDYVPTPPFYLFAQHFSAIAAAGPIAGPIIACQAWGWLPCLLWISLGVVLIGAVHDFSSLAASVRHGGSSIAEITRETLGPRAGMAMMAFIWLALIYVTVAFADITAAAFADDATRAVAAAPAAQAPKATDDEALFGDQVKFNKGGAVAAAAVMYLSLAVVLGLVQKFLNPPLWLVTVIFVPASLFVAWLGTQVSTLMLLDQRTWGLLILAYCFVASLTPMWVLLQPRGYLGGFILFFALAVGVVGVFFGNYTIQQPAVKDGAGFIGMTGTMFPFLFVTIACGACSGFHGLICSGTTSKQVERESHMHPIGYGAMLCEGFVALIALVTVMILADSDLKGKSPPIVYAEGIGAFMTVIFPVSKEFAVTFGAMAFSTFVFDTLDVGTRLGRYLLQELAGIRGRVGAILGTALTVAPPAFILWTAPAGSYMKFWTLFGASNQLLAALTLLAITVWLYKARKRIAFTLIPMVFVLVITLWSMVGMTINNIKAAQGDNPGMAIANAAAAIALVALALYLAAAAIFKVREVDEEAAGKGPAYPVEPAGKPAT